MRLPLENLKVTIKRSHVSLLIKVLAKLNIFQKCQKGVEIGKLSTCSR